MPGAEVCIASLAPRHPPLSLRDISPYNGRAIAFGNVPLWPAGHLPHKGGEDSRFVLGPIGALRTRRVKPLPLVGRGWGRVFSSICNCPALEGEMSRSARGGFRAARSKPSLSPPIPQIPR